MDRNGASTQASGKRVFEETAAGRPVLDRQFFSDVPDLGVQRVVVQARQRAVDIQDPSSVGAPCKLPLCLGDRLRQLSQDLDGTLPLALKVMRAVHGLASAFRADAVAATIRIRS